MTTSSAGVVTFLFTDLVGSTALIDRLGDDAADYVRREHFDVLRKAVDEAGGEEVKNLGDGLMVSFASPVAALSCAVAMQRAMAGGEHRIRVGVHAGEPVHEGDDYFGTPVVVAKRLCDRAEGGQILATELLAGLVGTRGGFQFLPRGRLTLKGLSEPVSTEKSAGRPTTPQMAQWRPFGDGHGPAGQEVPASLDGTTKWPSSTTNWPAPKRVSCGASCSPPKHLLSAEAGVGKTRLVREFLGRHDEVTPLQARAHPMGDTTAFGLWAEALDGHLRHLPANEVARCCGGFVLDLAEFAALAAGVSRAGTAAAMMAEFASVTGTALHAGMETLASAWAALAGSGSDAVALARQAISVLDELDFPLLQGRAYDVLGRALAGHDPDEAAGAFREAVLRFESCGAVWRRDRALVELDRVSS